MSLISVFLSSVHDTVHDFTIKMNYNEPKIYTGGVDIKHWNKLTKEEQKLALSKDWYVYYSYRHPGTNKLKRQPNLKIGVNRIKKHKQRYKSLENIKKALLFLLEKGFNPYDKTVDLNELVNYQPKKNTTQFITKPLIQPTIQTTQRPTQTPTLQNNHDSLIQENSYSFEKAYQFVCNIKKKSINEISFKRFESRLKVFKKWLIENKFETNNSIDSIDKKTIIQFLNYKLEDTTARNRNNYRTNLSTFFQTLVDNEIIKTNFVKSINVIKSTPKRNKTYTNIQQKDLFEYMSNNDPILLLFVKFISYNFLRPIEVCRLKVEDLNIQEKLIYVKAKNKPLKTKRIPDILLENLPDLSLLDPKFSLFTPYGYGKEWETTENNKRDYFTKRFKKVKDKFNLNEDYGLYSFRHTFITKLYKELNKTYTPFESKSHLMEITGHSTMTALEMYLRDIDAFIPEDYSKHFK